MAEPKSVGRQLSSPPRKTTTDTEWHADEWHQNQLAQLAHVQSEFFNVLSDQIVGPIRPDHTLRWEKLEFAPGESVSSRTGHIGAVVGDKMVIFGGYNGEKFGDHMFVVDTDPSEDGTYHCQSISSIDKVNKTYRVGHDGVVLATATNEKTQIGDTKFSETLYIFGGWNDETYVNNGLLFNVESLKLVVEATASRDLPPPRRDHTLVRMDDHLVLFGGWSQTYNGNELWGLNSQWQWSKVELDGHSRPAPCPRRGHTASVIGTRMYVIGGLYGFSKYLNDVHVFDLQNHQWTEPLLSGTAPSPRAWHKAVVIGNTQIMIYGGTSGRLSFYDEVYILDTAANCWFRVCVDGDVVPPPRASHSFVLTYLDEALVPEVPYTPRRRDDGNKPAPERPQLDDRSSEALAHRIVQEYEEARTSDASGRIVLIPPPPEENPPPPPEIERRVQFRALIFGGLTPVTVAGEPAPSSDRQRTDTTLSTTTTETDAVSVSTSSMRLDMPSPPLAVRPQTLTVGPRQISLNTFVSDDSSSAYTSQRQGDGGHRELNRIEVSGDFYQLILETPLPVE